jgi:hypothetical protein
VIRAALWSAAVISYRRAFSSGKALGQPQAPRLKIPDDWTKSLKQAQRNAHDEVLVIANKHVAHRVGAHEMGGVRALLAPPQEPREVVGIVSALGHVSEPAEHLPELLLQVCDVLIEKISRMKDELSNTTLEGFSPVRMVSKVTMALTRGLTWSTGPLCTPPRFRWPASLRRDYRHCERPRAKSLGLEGISQCERLSHHCPVSDFVL